MVKSDLFSFWSKKQKPTNSHGNHLQTSSVSSIKDPKSEVVHNRHVKRKHECDDKSEKENISNKKHKAADKLQASCGFRRFVTIDGIKFDKVSGKSVDGVYDYRWRWRRNAINEDDEGHRCCTCMRNTYMHRISFVCDGCDRKNCAICYTTINIYPLCLSCLKHYCVRCSKVNQCSTCGGYLCDKCKETYVNISHKGPICLCYKKLNIH